jgi:ABC-type multidrug transport system fused ATPase/permease subunit
MKTIFNILKQPKLIVLQAIALILLILSSAFLVILPLLASVVIDDFFAGRNISVGPQIIVVLVLLALVIPVAHSYLSNYLTEKIGFELKNKLIHKILRQDINYFLLFDQAKTFTMLTSDVNNIKDTWARFVNLILSAILLLTGSTYLMFRTNTNVATVVVIVIPLMLVGVIILFTSIRKLFRIIQESRDTMNRVIDENIKGAMLVRVFASENFERKKFEKINIKFRELSISLTKYFSLIFPVFISSMFVGQLIVIYFGGKEVIAGNMSLGDLSAFNGYILMFTAPFLILSFVLSTIGQAFASLGRINQVLTRPDLVEQKGISVKGFKSIDIKDLKLEFDGKKVLRDIDFTINKGEKIGIIGLTGSGKSMFISSLLHYYPQNTSGTIMLNGRNLKEYDIKQYRRIFGIVPQSPFILADSVKENIIFNRELDKEELDKAVITAQLSHFITNRDLGLEDVSGERGSTLSGGQKQRITIARALYGKPEILVLDDSSSKLDMTTEANLFRDIKTNYGNLAMIIVSQKIASIRDCDRIYVFDEGKVADSGTHEQLQEKSYLYQEFILSQNNYHDQ